MPGLVELEIGGMTCASCAARIEKRLNRLDGVVASVNYATETARVTYPPGLTPSDLIATVEQTGYTARVPRPPSTVAAESVDPEAAATHALRTRLRISVALAIPVVLLAMVPAWQFPNWQWLSAILATPVVFYGGWPFHRAAWANLRHARPRPDAGSVPSALRRRAANPSSTRGRTSARHAGRLTAS
jgi:Cu+-exporting ATPase